MKKLNGRIYTDGSEAFLLVSKPRTSRKEEKGEVVRISLAEILSVLKSSPSAADKDVLGKVIENTPSSRGLLKRSDIAASRLYAHRYGYETREGNELADRAPELLVDECVLIDSVVPLSESFGFATHVDLEGLGGSETTDAEVWQYAIDCKIPTFVTTDRDFLGMSLTKGAEDRDVPFLIYLSGRKKPGLEGICQLFQQYAGDIRGMMGRRQARGCRLSLAEGCIPIHS